MTNDELELQRREQTRRDIIANAEREVAAWSDPAFGSRLDTASLPLDFSGRESTFAEQAEDKHGLNRVDMSGFGGKSPLKQWLQAIDKGEITDAEAEFLAEETNDPNLILDHIDRKAAVVSNAFVASHPEYLAVDSNFKSLITEMAEMAGLPSICETREERNALMTQLCKMGFYTLENLTHAFHNLQAAGELDFPDGMFRPLSDKQKHIVRARLALGSVQEAITHYLAYAKGTHPDLIAVTNPQAFLHDPTNLPLIKECIAFVFAELHPEFVASPARIDFLLSWCGARFPTLALLTAGWSRLQQLEAQQASYAERRALLFDHDENEPPQVNEAQLEDLNDQQIHDLYSRTVRAIHNNEKANRR